MKAEATRSFAQDRGTGATPAPSAKAGATEGTSTSFFGGPSIRCAWSADRMRECARMLKCFSSPFHPRRRLPRCASGVVLFDVFPDLGDHDRALAHR